MQDIPHTHFHHEAPKPPVLKHVLEKKNSRHVHQNEIFSFLVAFEAASELTWSSGTIYLVPRTLEVFDTRIVP